MPLNQAAMAAPVMGLQTVVVLAHSEEGVVVDTFWERETIVTVKSKFIWGWSVTMEWVHRERNNAETSWRERLRVTALRSVCGVYRLLQL